MHRLFPLLLLASLSASSSEGHTLTLRIDGVQSTEGQLLVAVYNQAEGYPDKPETAFRKVRVKPVVPTSTVVVEGIPPGTYAAFAVHDVNGNDVVDLRAIIPMPKEPIGATRNAKGFMGPPKFSNASFEITGDLTERFSIKAL